MAILDRAASLTLTSLRFTAAGVASGYAVALDGPPSDTRPPSLAVPLTVLVSSTSALTTDVAIEVARDAGFTDIAYSNTLLAREDGIHSVTVAGLVDKTTYHWRARAAEAGTTGWSPWTLAWKFTPDLDAGKGFLYSEQNIGATTTTDPDAVWYSDQNVGFLLVSSSVGFGYSDFNVGIQITTDSRAFAYAHYGDANTLTPTPHIWFLVPSIGRSGDGIQIICFGAGDLQTTFSGVVEIYKGPLIGWQPVSVSSWQTFPPTVNAYTEQRTLDEGANIVDMQHQIIEITVPQGSVPPGYSLRIRTEGP